jgi:hypothetical protein
MKLYRTQSAHSFFSLSAVVDPSATDDDERGNFGLSDSGGSGFGICAILGAVPGLHTLGGAWYPGDRFTVRVVMWAG